LGLSSSTLLNANFNESPFPGVIQDVSRLDLRLFVMLFPAFSASSLVSFANLGIIFRPTKTQISIQFTAFGNNLLLFRRL